MQITADLLKIIWGENLNGAIIQALVDDWHSDDEIQINPADNITTYNIAWRDRLSPKVISHDFIFLNFSRKMLEFTPWKQEIPLQISTSMEM